MKSKANRHNAVSILPCQNGTYEVPRKKVSLSNQLIDLIPITRISSLDGDNCVASQLVYAGLCSKYTRLQGGITGIIFKELHVR
jgi:hypothetical protein